MTSVKSERKEQIPTERVLHLRKVEGLTVAVIAERFGVSESRIDHIIRKDREAKNAEKPT